MAAYHFTAKIHSRASGASAVRAAAYRAAERLHDERIGKTEDYSRKSDVIETAILTPDGAPEWCRDRQALWNRVEAREKRKDAQVAQEFEINLPREFSDSENWRLLTDFAREHLVANGRICDVAFHKPGAGDGEGHPHGHILMPLRQLKDGEFDAKHPDADWRNFANRQNRLSELRRDWCEFARKRAAELGIDLGADWDHRSYETRDLDIEPQPKVGATAHRMQDEGIAPDRLEELRATQRRNGERLLTDPGIALTAITRQQSTFTEQDLARWIHARSADDQFKEIFAKAKGQAVVVGTDPRGRTRYSTEEMIATEKKMLADASALADRKDHGVDGYAIAALDRTKLSQEQKAAATHILTGGDLSCLVGYAGAGKSTMLAEVKTVLEAQGYAVKGATLSGIAAENLEQTSGIYSRTLASWSHAWSQGKHPLSQRDILVIDEAGMVGSQQLGMVLDHARSAGAKVVLVGDPEQLQAIEAGAAFRAISERTGAAELTEIWRQQMPWQREATKELATGATASALGRYREAGCIHAADSDDKAHALLVERWSAANHESPDKSRIMLAHTRADAHALNKRARDTLQEADGLGSDVKIETNRGTRHFANGDRLMFLRNDRDLDVKNGTLGTIEKVSPAHLRVCTDDGRRLSVNPLEYRDIDYGYAVTVHKAQGVTVDQTFVLATKGFDRHLSYVALTRHRQNVTLVHSAGDFATHDDLARVLSRERAKDVTTDYIEEIADVRDCTRTESDWSKRYEELLAQERAKREAGPAQSPGLRR